MQRKPVFDAVRKLLRRGFRQDEVETLDRAMDCATDNFIQDSVPTVPSAGRNTGKTARQIGPAGTALIKRFEGCAKTRGDGKVEAYPDPGTGGDPWTIGWGATGRGISSGTIWTQAQCNARLAADLARYGAQVAQVIGDAPTSQTQFDALVAFHYNTGAIGKATLTRKHMAGDYAGAAREFDRWVHAGGQVMRGLVRRRAAEQALYRA